MTTPLNSGSLLQQVISAAMPKMFSHWIQPTARPDLPKTFLVVDWTGSWLAVTEIAQRGSSIQLGRTFRSQFRLSEPAGVASAGQWLRELMHREGIVGDSVVVAAPRRFVAFKLLTLPNVGDDRLGEAIRLQAETLFPVAADQLVVDYIAGEFNPDRSERSVLIAAMPKDQVERITQCMVDSGLTCLGIVVHDLALAHRVYCQTRDTLAIVSINPTKLEFVIASHGVPILCFAGRAPLTAQLDTDIISTLRRLMASIPSTDGVPALTRLHLIDCPPALNKSQPAIQPSLIAALKKSLGIEVTHQRAVYDELFKASAVIDAYSLSRCRLDFFGPRQPTDHRRLRMERQVKWIGTAALVLLLGYTLAAFNTRRLNSRLTALQARQASLEQAIEKRRPAWDAAAATDQWQASQLDASRVIKDYLTELPDTQEIVLTRLEMSRGSDNTNSIEIEGQARQAECVNRLVDALASNPRYSKTQLRSLEAKPGDLRYGAEFALTIALRGTHHVRP